MNRFQRRDPDSPTDSNVDSPGNQTHHTDYDNPWGVSDCEEDEEEDNNRIPDYVPPAQVLPKQRSATRMSAVMNEEMQHQQNPVQQPRAHSERYSARSVFFPQTQANNGSTAGSVSAMNRSHDGSVKMTVDDVDDFEPVDENYQNRNRVDTLATAADSDGEAEAEYSYSYSSSKHAPFSGPPPSLTAAAAASSSHSVPVPWQNRAPTRGSPPRDSPASGGSKLSVDTDDEHGGGGARTNRSLSPGSSDRSSRRNTSPNPSLLRKPSLPAKPGASPTVTRSRSSSLSPSRQPSSLPKDLHSIMGILEDDHSEEERQMDGGSRSARASSGGVSPPKMLPKPTVESSAHTTGGQKLVNLLKEARGQASGGATDDAPKLRHSASGVDALKGKPLTKPPLIANGSGGMGPHHSITRSSTMPPLSTHVPSAPIVPHSALVTSKLAPLSEFAVNTMVIMEGWMERKTSSFLGGWKKVYAVLSESTEHVCVLHMYDKMLHTSWGNVPLHLKAHITLNTIETIETESHRYARGREFTIRKRVLAGHGPGSGHSSRSPSPLMSPLSVVSGSPGDGYDSDRGSVASGGSANSRDSKASVLSWFGKGSAGPKDIHLRCDDAETRLIWTVLLMKALELANP